MQDQDRLSVFLSYLGFLILVPPFLAYVFLSKASNPNVFLTLFFLLLTAMFGSLPFLSFFLVARSPYSRFHAQQGVLVTFVFLLGVTFMSAIRWIFLSLQWTTQWLYVVFFLWIFIYIFVNILAATSGFLGKTWKIPLVGRMTTSSDVR